MTRAEVRICGTRCTLKLEGHATGHPEVCAAISTLAGSLEAYLENWPEAVEEVYCWRVQPGDVEMDIEGSEDAKAAFRLVAVGLARLELACEDALVVEALADDE